MEDWAEQVARQAVALRESLGRGVAVGISGVDCAGKSSLAAAVARRLEEEGIPVTLVEGDEFTRPARERHAEPDLALGYYRDSFDFSTVFEQILPAVRGSEGDVVIVEGCFLFAGGRASEFDLSVWLDLPLEQVVERALRRPRDLERMGGPDGVRARYGTRYVPGQRLHLERDRPQEQATLVLRAS